MRLPLANWFGRRRSRETDRAQKFLQRYTGRTLIVHAGLSIAWLEELLREGGGGAHFRVDVRLIDGPATTPVEWLARVYLSKLDLPLPLLLDVASDSIKVRHLQRGGRLCLATDVAWILEDMRTRNRVHATLLITNEGLKTITGMAVDDNRYAIDTDTWI